MSIRSVSEVSNPNSTLEWIIYVIPVVVIAAVVAGSAVFFKRRIIKIT